MMNVFGVLYGLIALVSFVMLGIDWFLVRVDSSTEPAQSRPERVDSSMRALLMLLIPVGIIIALWLVRGNLLHLNWLTEKQVAVLVAEAFWLMLLRKLVVIIVPSIFSYICLETPSFQQRYQRFVVYKGHGISLITRAGVTISAVVMLLLDLITTAFPSLALSRLNVITHKYSQLFSVKLMSAPAITLVWLAMAVVFWFCLIRGTQIFLLRRAHTTDDDEAQDAKAWYETANLGLLAIIALVLVPVRKLYDWLAVMSNYRLEDILFSLVIAIIIVAIVLINWLRHRPASNS